MTLSAAFADFFSRLEKDRRHGASELARQCLLRLAESARAETAGDADGLRRILCEQKDRLCRARPSMAPIRNLLGRWERGIGGLPHTDLTAFREKAADLARDLVADSRRAVEETAAVAAAACTDGATIITHSYSSTLVEAFRRLRVKKPRVIVSESRPLCEGRRLASRLAEWSLPVTLITDAQLGLFAAEADLAMVGADSLLADGSAVNKAGTYLLALAARDRGIPFYVCCESFKWLGPDAFQVVLEEMGAAELGAKVHPEVRARNVYFDLTPAALISGWCSENGLHTRWHGID